MQEVLDVSSLIDDEGVISSFAALLGQPFEACNPADDIRCYTDLNKISQIDLHINRKEFTFKFQGKKWTARIGNFIFFTYFLNKLSDRKASFFIRENAVSYDDISDVNISIILHEFVEFRFEIDCNVLKLKRISVSAKFIPNKYRQYDMLERYTSVD